MDHDLPRRAARRAPRCASSSSVEDDALGEALEALEAGGQVERSGEGDGGESTALTTFVVPVDAERGWEAAVFDHFSDGGARDRHQGAARRRALARTTTSSAAQRLSFDVHPEHPHRDEVLGLLKRVRAEVNELWTRVQRHNDEQPDRGGDAGWRSRSISASA